MKVRELLRLLFWPLIILCILDGGHTFFAQYTQGLSKLLDYINSIIDMRDERTIGTWYETLLFAFTGISFFLVSRHPALSKIGRSLLVLMALGFCFLSADEMLSLHEFMGYKFEQATGIVKGTHIDQRGFSWVLVYTPAALAVFGILFSSYRRMTKTLPVKTANTRFLLAWVAIGLVILLEVADGLSTIEIPVLPCIEECCELLFIMLFYSANLLIAEAAEL